MEVIEHVDEPRLPALADAVFGHARPTTVIVTTPNVEYNVRYEGLTGLRHHDHRFEWDRAAFAPGRTATAAAYGYTRRRRRRRRTRRRRSASRPRSRVFTADGGAAR